MGDIFIRRIAIKKGVYRTKFLRIVAAENDISIMQGTILAEYASFALLLFCSI